MNSRLSLVLLLCLGLYPIWSFAAAPTDEAKPAAASTGEAKPAAASTGEAKPAAASTGEAKPADATAQAQPTAAPAAEPKPTNGPTLVGDIQAGKGKTQTCVACHGTDGNSTVPNWPKIAGQYENYLVKELREFRAGEKGPRFEASMYAMVANLSDQDIADLAAYYASEKQTMGKAQNAYVELGQKIYRGGNLQTGATACLACHGPEGQGNEAARYPKLAGQHAVYIENQLHAFKDGKRKNSPSEMMESISHRLSDEEMKAVSSYIEGLR